MTRATLLRAAEILAEDAEILRASHTLDDRWILIDSADELARADHDERVSIAAKLQAMAAA